MFTFGQTRVRQVRHQSSANSEPKKFARTFQLKSEAEELYLDHRHIRVGFSFTSSQGCQIKSLCWVFHLQGYVDHAALERVHGQVDIDFLSDFSVINPGSQNENVTSNLDGYIVKTIWILFQWIDFCTLPGIRQVFSALMFKKFKPNIS